MPQIIPIRDLRNTTKLSEMCNATNEPIFITKNGYGDMVVMSITAYEERLAQIDMYSKIMEAKAQADNGDLADGPAAIAKMRVKYPKSLVDELHNEIENLKEGIKNGRTPVFDNIDSLFDSLENS